MGSGNELDQLKLELVFCKAILRLIAMSYRERLDRADTPPYEFATDALEFLSDDIELISADNEQVNELLRDFRQWRKRHNGNAVGSE